MKRFHVHVHVDDLAKSIGFYSKLFAAEPTRIEGDYAKWMLDDPRINFAISTRGSKAGIDHLGFQTDDAEELAALKARAEAADMALLDALRRDMPATGSVITWNQTFERGINDKLAARNPSAASFLAGVNARVVDLMDVFSDQAYVHPGFRGRTSIKAILPVLVPELSYTTLAIQEGATATVRWNEIATGAVSEAEARRIAADLLAYCALDTRAMVEIWRVLEGEVGRWRIRRWG